MAKLKLNEKLIEEAAKLIKSGNYASVVCKYFGIDESTWYRWLEKGERIKNENNIYRKFFNAIKKAEATAEGRNVAIIQDAAQTTWQAAAWYLERKYPDRWGKKDQMDLNHSGGIEIKVDWS